MGKITVSLPSETIHVVDSNRARFGFHNRSKLVDTALREYISQRLLEEMGQPGERIEPNDIKNMEDHLAKLSYKVAVELAQMNLLWASVLDISDEDVRSLRGQAVRLLKQTRGYIPLHVANKNALVIETESDSDMLDYGQKQVYQTEIRDILFSVTCDGPQTVDNATMDKILRSIQYIIVSSSERP